MKPNRKAIIITTVCASGLALAGATQMTSESRVVQEDKTEVGIVQSDLIIQQYKGVESFQRDSQMLQQEFTQAQQQGDQEKMLDIQNRFAQMQDQFQQKFESDLKAAAEKVANEKEIDFVVSEVIYQSDKVTEVNLTNDLIKTMNED